MKTKAILLLMAFSLVSAGPAYAQGEGHHYGRGHGRGNPHTDKQGPQQGNDLNDDGDVGFDGDFALLKAKTAEIVASLAIGSLATPDGAPIPISAQGKLYVVMTNSVAYSETPPAASVLVNSAGGAPVSNDVAPSTTRFIDSFTGAGPYAMEKLRTLTLSLSGLAYEPRRLPTAVSDFNAFVEASLASFLTNPPPEFVALHAVLNKLSAGLPKK